MPCKLANSSMVKCHQTKVMKCGVPQGSCLDTVLFVLYASWLFRIISLHLPEGQTDAVDTQLHMSFRPSDDTGGEVANPAMHNCITELQAWVINVKLKINDPKTEFIINGSTKIVAKVNIDSITDGQAQIILGYSSRQ